tara:strand:+ start:56 stop:214 length:159 start_codon:yes stop_codon:yes gene_type:complete
MKDLKKIHDELKHHNNQGRTPEKMEQTYKIIEYAAWMFVIGIAVLIVHNLIK